MFNLKQEIRGLSSMFTLSLGCRSYVVDFSVTIPADLDRNDKMIFYYSEVRHVRGNLAITISISEWDLAEDVHASKYQTSSIALKIIRYLGMSEVFA